METLEKNIRNDQAGTSETTNDYVSSEHKEEEEEVSRVSADQTQRDVRDDNDDESIESQAETPPPPRPQLNEKSGHIKRPKVVRRKRTVDIETGNSMEHSMVCQDVLDTLYEKPMDPRQRRWKKFLQYGAVESKRQRVRKAFKQYRLTRRRTRHGLLGFMRQAAEEDFRVIRGLNFLVSDYILWTFQTHVFLVFASAALMYLILTLTFGGLIYAFARFEPFCLDFNEEVVVRVRGHYFQDAFALSWQTFSTTGYGAIAPALSSHGHLSCSLMNMLVALESFTGILFVGFGTAVVFGNVARVHAVANVEFSDPIVVRYGSGVLPTEEDGLSDVSSEIESKLQGDNDNYTGRMSLRRNASDIPCPILEFRLMNGLHDHVGGEICNASVNVVATISATHASRAKRTSANLLFDGMHQKLPSTSSTTMRAGGGLSRVPLHRGNVSGFPPVRTLRNFRGDVKNAHRYMMPDHLSPVIPESEPFESFTSTGTDLENQMPLGSPCMSVTVDEEPSSALVPRLIYSKLEIETDHHPLFKRVWTIRHTLNEKSPLLSKRAQTLIESNRGFWPAEMNNHDVVRKHIRFHQILVNFSGIANVSGSSVYAQKMYDHADVNVGYCFAGMLLKSSDCRLIVDGRLLNDVTEQHGGGAEPLVKYPCG